MIRQLFFACAILWFWASPAWAQISVVVVVPHVDSSNYEHFEHRLRSELVAEGFQPVSVEISDVVTARTLQRHATRLMSPAAIGITVDDRVVSGLVWVRGRGATSDLLRPVPEYPVNEQAPVVFAVRATDILHGGLLELGYIGGSPEPTAGSWNATPPPSGSLDASSTTARSGPPNAASSATTTGVQKTTDGSGVTSVVHEDSSEEADRSTSKSKPKREKSPRAWQFRSTVGLGIHALSFPTNLGFGLSALRRLRSDLSLGLHGTYFPPIASDATNQGRANVTVAFAGARFEYLQALTKWWTLFEFIESGLHATFVTGDAAPSHVERPARSYTVYSGVGLGSVWAINGTVGLLVQSEALLPWRRSDVIVVRTVVANAAGPALSLSAGLQLAF